MRRSVVIAVGVWALSGCGTSNDDSPSPTTAGSAGMAGNSNLAGSTNSSGATSSAGANAGGSAGGTAAGAAGQLNGPAGSAGDSPTAGTSGQGNSGDGNGGNDQGGAGGGSGGLPNADAGAPGGCQETGVMIGITEAHNAVRDTVDPPNGTPLPPLDWSCEVAAIAQAYADELAATMDCDLVHSDGDYGENLYWSSGFQPTPQDVVDAWASEEPCYTYDVFPDQCSEVPGQCDVCGHYTQMVWRNTEFVGCGMAECGQAQVWVCNYDPPGNYINQLPY